MDWYRRKSWTKADEDEFFTRLSRARKESRAQYLRIQAIELVQTRDIDLLKVAESLLMRMLSEYPDNKLERSSALHTLGDIHKINGDLEKAIEYYKQAIDFEAIFPNVRTNAFLDYSELIIKTRKTDQFDHIEAHLLKILPEQIFPILKYKTYSILSVINRRKNNDKEARAFAALAKEYANATTSGLRYHKELGLVKEDDLLDSLSND